MNPTMKSFTAFTNVSGQEIRFVGNTWEDAGFHTDADGDPVRDRRGNTISRFAVAEVDERDSDELVKAFGGGPDFIGWMRSRGVSERVAQAVSAQVSLDS
jgi:hypothetical protein